MKLYYKSSMYVESKTEKMAYRFWFLFGSHHAYLGKWTRQAILWIMLLSWTPHALFPSIALFEVYYGIFSIALPALALLWMVADLILIPYYVKKYNELQYTSRPGTRRSEPVVIEEETEQLGYPITY